MIYLKILRFLLVTAIAVMVISANALAFSSPDSSDSTKAKAISSLSIQPISMHELSFWGGYSFDSMLLWGKTPNTTMHSLGLRYNMQFMRIYTAEVEYIFKLSLYSKYSYPEFKEGRPRNSITGFGIVPVGFQLNFRGDKTVQPFLNTTGGFMYFQQPFPDFRGKRFNFTFAIGGGFEFMLSESVSLSLGVRYHHLSNGQLGQVNPGIDSSMFYSAITIF